MSAIKGDVVEELNVFVRCGCSPTIKVRLTILSKHAGDLFMVKDLCEEVERLTGASPLQQQLALNGVLVEVADKLSWYRPLSEIGVKDGCTLHMYGSAMTYWNDPGMTELKSLIQKVDKVKGCMNKTMHSVHLLQNRTGITDRKRTVDYDKLAGELANYVNHFKELREKILHVQVMSPDNFASAANLQKSLVCIIEKRLDEMVTILYSLHQNRNITATIASHLGIVCNKIA